MQLQADSTAISTHSKTVVLAFSIPLCSNYSILIKPSNTTKYVSLLSILFSRTTK